MRMLSIAYEAIRSIASFHARMLTPLPSGCQNVKMAHLGFSARNKSAIGVAPAQEISCADIAEES